MIQNYSASFDVRDSYNNMMLEHFGPESLSTFGTV